MLSRVFLAAGVAALAIATPALAGPGDHGHGGGQHGGGAAGGGGGGPHGGGGGGGPHGGGGGPAFMGGGGGHGGGGPAFMGFRGGGGSHGGGGGPAFMGFRGGGHGGGGPAYMGFRGGGRGGGPRFAAPQMRGYAHQQFRGGYAHQQFRGGHSRQQFRGGYGNQFRMAQRGNSHGFARQQFRGGRGHQQFRMAQNHQAHGFARQQAHGFAQGRGFSRQQARMAQRGNFQGRSMQMRQQQAFAGRQPNAQQFAGRGKFAGNAGQFANSQLAGNGAQFRANQMANGRLGGGQFSYLNTAPYSTLAYGNNVQVMPFEQANRFIGAPIAQVAGIAGLAPLPAAIQYLYPDTSDYYYRYGDGYLYQVDRATDLVAALIPLLAGGFLPGEYLPVAYMSDYVPDYYGFNAFYPDYGDVCNRYYGGVIYQVDCEDGYVEDVIPMYAGGYGVGELLPTAYSYYNVPLQYRGLYYDTPDAGYWYSPGAIYQYDPRTNIITSVAALMGPGLAIGQPLPVGYTVYNVPYSYRAVYYDTPSAWYRYSNGYIYQVDPVTQLVTAIVASLMT